MCYHEETITLCRTCRGTLASPEFRKRVCKEARESGILDSCKPRTENANAYSDVETIFDTTDTCWPCLVATGLEPSTVSPTPSKSVNGPFHAITCHLPLM